MEKTYKKLSLRLSKSEYENLQSQLYVSGMKGEPYLRKLLASQEIKPRPTEGQLRLVREISGIANNINQITRLANTVKSVSPAQVEELQRLCSEALSLLKMCIRDSGDTGHVRSAGTLGRDGRKHSGAVHGRGRVFRLPPGAV